MNNAQRISAQTIAESSQQIVGRVCRRCNSPSTQSRWGVHYECTSEDCECQAAVWVDNR
jgi:hypothetical protein